MINRVDLLILPGKEKSNVSDYMADGYVHVPERPGLGVDLNLEAIEENLRRPGLFEPTDEWNDPKLGFWRPDNRWPE